MLPGALALNLAFFMISSMTLNNVVISLPLVLMIWWGFFLFFLRGGGVVVLFLVTEWGPRILFCRVLCESWIPIFPSMKIFKMYNSRVFENYLRSTPCQFLSF